MMSVQITGTQKIQATIQPRETKGKNRLEKITEMLIIVTLKAIRHNEGMEKEWSKFGLNPLNLIQQPEGFLTKLESF